MSYSKSSVYFNTPISSDGTYLDMLVSRHVPAFANDQPYQIEPKYYGRPDLLAFDVYGDAGLWWVFAERNPNTIKDPIGDFIVGTFIYLPDKNELLKGLSI